MIKVKKEETIRENGITLVALIITIIILLILAGISIANLTQTGLFEKAQEAKEKTEIAYFLLKLSKTSNNSSAVLLIGPSSKVKHINLFSLSIWEISTLETSQYCSLLISSLVEEVVLLIELEEISWLQDVNIINKNKLNNFFIKCPQNHYNIDLKKI